MSIEIEGLDELQDQLSQMQENAQELDGENEDPFSELFDSSFMSEHTAFSDFDALLEAGGFEVETQEDFEAIPEKKLDPHIQETTVFESWEEMRNTAVQNWVAGQMGL